jgi:hypothetical protein
MSDRLWLKDEQMARLLAAAGAEPKTVMIDATEFKTSAIRSLNLMSDRQPNFRPREAQHCKALRLPGRTARLLVIANALHGHAAQRAELSAVSHSTSSQRNGVDYCWSAIGADRQRWRGGWSA